MSHRAGLVFASIAALAACGTTITRETSQSTSGSQSSTASGGDGGFGGGGDTGGGDSGTSVPETVAVDSQDNIIVVEDGSADGLVFYIDKLDSYGQRIWRRGYGQGAFPGGYRLSVAVDQKGNIAVGGQLASTGATFGNIDVFAADGANGFVAGITPNGDVTWARAFGGINDGTSAVTSLAFAPNGDLLASGLFDMQVDFGTGPIPDYYGDNFVLRMNPADGTTLWTKQVKDGWLPLIASSDNGDIVFAATYQAKNDPSSGVLVARLDSSGNEIFHESFPGDGDPSGLVVWNGHIFIAGTLSGHLQFGTASLDNMGSFNVFVTKLDDAGQPMWARQLSGTGFIANARLAMSNTQVGPSVLLAADCDCPAAFEDTTVVPTGGQDTCILRLDYDGGHVAQGLFSTPLEDRIEWMAALSSGWPVVVGVSVDEGNATNNPGFVSRVMMP